MKKFRKLVCILLAVMLFIMIPISTSAAETDDDMHPVQISVTAGSHGVYVHDMETNTETFISVEEYESLDVPDTVPAGGDALMEDEEVDTHAIIGSDDRTKVTSPSTNGKCNSTCLLGSRFYPASNSNSFVAVGTGWLAGNNCVVTAGHVIYNTIDGPGYAHHVAVYLAASNGTKLQYRECKNLHTGSDFRDNCGSDEAMKNKGCFDDWGIIQVDEPFTVTQHLGRKAVNNASYMTGRSYSTQGYPQDRNEANGKPFSSWAYWDMYYQDGTVGGGISMASTRFLQLATSSFDSSNGQSGSPIYEYISGSGYCAEAILIGDQLEYGGSTETVIILITSYLHNYISNITG